MTKILRIRSLFEMTHLGLVLTWDLLLLPGLSSESAFDLKIVFGNQVFQLLAGIRGICCHMNDVFLFLDVRSHDKSC